MCGLNHIAEQMHKNCQVVICCWVTQHSQFNLQQWWCFLGKCMVTACDAVCVLGTHPHWSLDVVCFKHCWHSLQVVGILPKGCNQIYQVKQHLCHLRCKKEMSVGNGLWKMRWNHGQVWGGVVACTIKMLWLVVCIDLYLLDKLQTFLAALALANFCMSLQKFLGIITIFYHRHLYFDEVVGLVRS